MSADDAETKKSSPPYLPVAGALFLGIVIGAAMQNGDDAALKVKRDLEARVEAAEATAAAAEERAAAAIADAQAAAAAGAEEAAQAAAAKVAEVQTQLDAITAGAEASGDAEELAALGNRVQILAEQMASMILAMRTGAPAEAMAEVKPAAEEAGPAADIAALVEAIGEDGLTLAVGQTGSVREARVFMSRIDAEEGEARIMVVGEGPTMIGPRSGPVELGNGCVLTMAGIAEGRAYIKAACDSEG